MSGNGREALTDNREWSGTLLDVQERLEGFPGCPKVIVRPSRMSGSGREALPNVQEWSGAPLRCADAIPDVQE